MMGNRRRRRETPPISRRLMETRRGGECIVRGNEENRRNDCPRLAQLEVLGKRGEKKGSRQAIHY